MTAFRSVLVSRLCASAALVICLIGLAGHLLAVPEMFALRSSWQAMSLVTALGFGMIASAAAIPQLPIRLRTTLCVTSAVIGFAVLASRTIYGDDEINPWFYHLFTSQDDSSMPIGRTSGATALSMLMLGIALIPGRKVTVFAKERLAAITFLISSLALLGYMYGAKDLYSLPLFNTMAVNTAATIVLLSFAGVMAAPDHGWAHTIWLDGAAGRATRRQITFLAFPILLGWALVRWSAQGSLGLGAAMALLVLLTIAMAFILIVRDGRSLENLDRERVRSVELSTRHAAELEDKLKDQAEQLRISNASRLQIAEKAQLKSETRYGLLFDSIDTGFCVIEMAFDDIARSIDYRFLEINAAFEHQTGLKNALGRRMRELAPAHEQHWFDTYGEVARSGQPIRFELFANELGGRWYDVHAFRVDDPALRHVGILFNDVTVRRNAESQLRDLNSTLESKVKLAMAERELAHAALRQSQKMEAIGQLTGGVAHDFNNLLAPIMTTLDVFLRRGGTSERETRLLQGALRSAERAKVLIQRLLAFARRQPLQVGAVDLDALIGGLTDLISSTLGAKIQLDLQLTPILPIISGDANQLEMAVLNLCVNARDAMADGGRLTIATRAEQVDAGNPFEIEPGKYVCLTVTDTGIGMDEATAKRAIEPFFSTKGIGQGTGLGLSMAHGLAAQLGGSLQITSQPGQGTTIALWLKQSDTSPIAVEAPLTDMPRAGEQPRGRVLVVDDEDYVRLSTSDMLHEMGYETADVASAEAAQQLLDSGSAFDLVVTDQMMPGMTGIELMRVIRERWPSLPVLIVSGYTAPAEANLGLAFLSKPFRLQEFHRSISDLLERPAPA